MSVKKIHVDINDAINENDLDKLKQLLSQGVDLTEVWTDECHPLNFAENNNNLDMVKLLIENGSPLYCNTQFEVDNSRSIKEVENELFGLNWHADHHETTLYSSTTSKKNISSGLISLAELEESDLNKNSDEYFNKLLEMGLDIDEFYRSSDNTTLASFISCSQNTRYIERLIGISKDINKQKKPNQLSTPLADAIRIKNRKIVELLLAHNVNIHIYDSKNRESLFDLALKMETSYDNDSLWIVQELKKRGAKTYQQMLDDGDIPAI
jgi:ankyrin repeat protein